MRPLRLDTTIFLALVASLTLTGMTNSHPESIFVSVGLKGEPLPPDECLRRCIGCPFHEHRFFYKYKKDAPTVATDSKGIFPVFYGGDVISKLGDDRDGRKHRGIDIQSTLGSAVVAAWSGKVHFAGWNRLGGCSVILKHKNGYVTYYAHLKDRPVLYPGQTIVAGQRIGAVGMSGNAKGTVPHLHFEVLKDKSGRALDPLHIL